MPTAKLIWLISVSWLTIGLVRKTKMAKLFFKQDGNLLNLFLDSPVEPVNALAGEINLPPGFKLERIQTGNSLVSFWVDSPVLTDEKIIFSGIIPGGYQETAGPVFSLVFSATPSDRIQSLKVSKAQVLLHDGLGTKTAVETPEVTWQPFAADGISVDDKISPEEFEPLIASDPSLFDGRHFLVFQTQDKQSGMDHFEIKEGDGAWQTATSPYLISHQNLDKRIQIKAVDLAGNERSMIAFSPPWSPADYAFWSIIILVLILCLFVCKKLFRR